jgi:Escherichia/Staphylococcus phage prohead protease
VTATVEVLGGDKRTSPARENLCRSVPFTAVRAETGNGDGRTFTGYGAVFNQPTRIDSIYEGTFDEQIALGAFRKSIRETTPKFQFDHGRHPLIGSVPIGVINDIHEDEQGLYVQARMGEHIIIDLIREALATGAIDGMSFRFDVVRDEWRDREGTIVKPGDVDRILFYGEQPERQPLLRTLKEVKVAEVGPVVWPAYAGTSATVRSDEPITIYPDRLHEPGQRKLLAEAVLRAEAVDSTPEEGEIPATVGDKETPTSRDGESSEDEPRDTAGEAAVEHSGEDTDTPQPTERAGEHLSDAETDDSAPPTDEVDAARAAEVERLYTAALSEVQKARDATPPMKGL